MTGTSEEQTREERERQIEAILELIPRRFHDWNRLQYAVAVTIGVLCLPLGMLLQNARYQRWDSNPHVDGKRLTHEEMEYIRGLRTYTTLLRQQPKDMPAKVAIRYKEIMADGAVKRDHRSNYDAQTQPTN